MAARFQSAVTAIVLVIAVMPAAGQRLSDRDFLELATKQVHKYSETFHDLTAQETATIEFFDADGKVRSTRKVKSALIVYQSQTNSKESTEYRDVEEVDGNVIKDHERRAIRLFEALSGARSVKEELDRINKEGERYNNDVLTVNITLNQGFPLRLGCRHKFQFGFIRAETLNGVATRVYGYDQTEPCGNYSYKLGLPAEFESGEKMHRGLLWLEESNGRLMREIREVYARSKLQIGVELKGLRCVFDYDESAFAIRTPRKIVITSYAPVRYSLLQGAVTVRPAMAMTQEYGTFSRFDVSVQQHVVYPDTPQP